MKIIKLTKGQEALVDDGDFWLLRIFKWHCGRGYAANSDLGLMHRFLMKDPVGLMVDHIDGNRLNNQRANLRIVTAQQNQSNRRKGFGASKYVGLCWEPKFGRWKVTVMHAGKSHYVGVFRDELDAAQAYNDASIRLRGDYAGINVIDGYTHGEDLARPDGRSSLRKQATVA